MNNILEGHGEEGIFGWPNIVRVAAWADDYAHTHKGAWSKTHHFIDIKDRPPHTCSQTGTIDQVCNDGCVVTAM